MNRNLILRNRAFRNLWIAQITSQIGDRILQLALAWWMLETTNSAFNLGFLMVLASLPTLLLGPLGGAVIDAFDRKRIMVAADLGRAAIVSGLAVLYYTHHLQVWQVYVGILLLSSLAPFFNPSVPASIPHLVGEEDLHEATSLESAVSSTSGLIGPVVGGLLIGFIGIGGGMLVDALTFLVSAALVLTLPLPGGSGKTKLGEILQQLQEGISYARSQATLFHLLVAFAGVNLFLVPSMVLSPMFIRLVLHGESWMLGMVEGAVSVGMIASAILVARLGEIQNKRPLILGALSMTALSLLLMVFARTFAVGLVLHFLIGLAVAGININMSMVFQRMVIPEMKGRFFALVGVITSCSFPLAFLWVGILAQKTSVPLAYLVCGIGLILVLAYIASIRGLSEIGGVETTTAAEV